MLRALRVASFLAVGTACVGTNAPSPSEAGTSDSTVAEASEDAGPSGPNACAAIGGKCLVGGAFCLTRGTPDCNPGRNPGGAFCCLDGVGNTCTDGGMQVIVASNYDQSCSKDSDCVAIAAGNVCYPCIIECATGAAINIGAMSQYQADIEKTSAWKTIQSTVDSYDAHYIPCGCPLSERPCCQAGMCQRGCSAPSDAGADVLAADGSSDGGD